MHKELADVIAFEAEYQKEAMRELEEADYDEEDPELDDEGNPIKL